MKPDALDSLLMQVARGEVDVAQAVKRLRDLPFEDLGFARVDHHRQLRGGAPEVIFGAGKQPDHVAAIARSLIEQGSDVLCTRTTQEAYDAVRKVAKNAEFNASARCIIVQNTKPCEPRGRVGVVCAGTADLPVAEEAAVTASFLGAEVVRIADVGVAGIHRLLGERTTLEGLDIAIVVAGMEGALPSVVGGLVAAPVIAVPTSIGYGASFGGLAALLAMLNACASGITVVNIDNGFGAAAAAHRILYAQKPGG